MDPPSVQSSPAASATSLKAQLQHWARELRARMTARGAQAKLAADEVALLLQRAKSDDSIDSATDSDCLQLTHLLRLYTDVGGKSGQVPVSTAAAPQAAAAAALTPSQLHMLKYQLAAFRYISHNMPVPPALQQALLGGDASTGVAQRVVEAAFARTKSGDDRAAMAAAKEAAAKKSAAHAPMADGDDVDPYVELATKVPFNPHRILVPALMPVGLDPVALVQERERRIQNRIAFRIAELESLPANMGTAVAPTSAVDENNSVKHGGVSEDKVKALVELKSLRLLEKQRVLRAELVSGLKRSTTLATAVSRVDYRRVKKPSMREIRLTEKLERQQRMDVEKKSKLKHVERLNQIVQHGRDMRDTRRQLAQKQYKLGRGIIQWHANVEREEQKTQERMTKERIRALKEDDEEAYLKLIDKQKDTRLTHLIQQTGQYLDTLSSLVLEQQADIRSREAAVDVPKLPEGEVEDEEDKVDYFNIAHRIREPVTEQASILSGGKLKDYQIKGLEWMVSLYNNKLNGILADEMGLGKTIQTISLITYLIEKKNQNGPFLVIVPLSTITNWTLEFEKWAPSVVKVVYKGTPNQRRDVQLTQMRNGTFNVLLTTYEYIVKDKAVLSKFSWIHTIIDEGHRMKNANSKLSVTLTQYYSSRYRLILTGTPLQNNLPELWALLNFTLPKVFNSVKSFDEWFNTPFANTGERIELNEEEQLLIIKRLHKVLRPFLLRRLKRDVESDLPDKTEHVVKTPMSSLQQKLYNQIRASGAMLTGGEGKKGVRSVNNAIMQLRKVCNHPFVFEEIENTLNPNHATDQMIIRVSGKFELLDRMLGKLKATGHRVLMFFQMTQVMDIMEDFLRYCNFNYLRLDGSTKTEDRSIMLKQFNAPDSEYFIFILSTRAGGLGLNLQTADTVIIFDSDWNPHQDLQAQDRAHRIGQTKAVRIYRLITSNSVEEHILSRAQYKLDIDGKVIQAGKFDNKSTNEEREQFLRSLFDTNADAGDEEDANGSDIMDADDELNEILARNNDELEAMRKYDATRNEQDQRKWKAQGHKGPYPRLITLDELPAVFLHDAVPVKEEKVEEMGRGRRTKDDVRYDDGLTEDQWTRAIDNEQDINELVDKKRKRAEKRRSKKLQTGTDDEDETDEGAVEAPRKTMARGRKSQDIGCDEGQGEDESAAAVQSNRRKKIKLNDDAAGKDDILAMHQMFSSAFDTVRGCVELADDGSERVRCELFLELPSRKLYPDYYRVIRQPIAMATIQDRMASNHYRDMQQFQNDFELMFRNAMKYNEEGSPIYEDAVVLRDVFLKSVAELTSEENSQSVGTDPGPTKKR